jgi:hypothetical protein
MIKKYRKKPVVIEAIQFNCFNYKECEEFLEGNYDNTTNEPNVVTLEGYKPVYPGYWIVKGIAGEFYPVEPKIFKATYEEVMDNCPACNVSLIGKEWPSHVLSQLSKPVGV